MMTSPDFTSILQGSHTNSNENEWEFDICKENITNIENITFRLTITMKKIAQYSNIARSDDIYSYSKLRKHFSQKNKSNHSNLSNVVLFTDVIMT